MRVIEFLLEETFGTRGRIPLLALTAASSAVFLALVWGVNFYNHGHWLYYWTGVK